MTATGTPKRKKTSIQDRDREVSRWLENKNESRTNRFSTVLKFLSSRENLLPEIPASESVELVDLSKHLESNFERSEIIVFSYYNLALVERFSIVLRILKWILDLTLVVSVGVFAAGRLEWIGRSPMIVFLTAGAVSVVLGSRHDAGLYQKILAAVNLKYIS